MELESAIPVHLTQERKFPVKTPPNYEPPFPAYSARFPGKVKDLVMAIIGAQHEKQPESKSAALSKLIDFAQAESTKHKPQYWEIAAVTDPAQAYNEVLIAYWSSKSAYTSWSTESGFDAWWQSLDPKQESNGWFKEVFFPPVDRFETVFSDNVVPEGAAHMREGMSGPIREHVYWGSMRDRLPASQTDLLTGQKPSSFPSSNASGENNPKHSRISVPGPPNLALIRSGQDWSATPPTERTLYLETMHPVLIKGMEFLTHHGSETGCFSNRFMTVLDPVTFAPTEKTFGLGYFDDLASLEKWSKSHKTHLDIFGRFLNYAKELQNQVALRLFHEVVVLEEGQQEWEYVGCHGKTGMMGER